MVMGIGVLRNTPILFVSLNRKLFCKGNLVKKMIGVCENPNHCLYLHLHTQCADSTIDFENGSFDRTACFLCKKGPPSQVIPLILYSSPKKTASENR